IIEVIKKHVQDGQSIFVLHVPFKIKFSELSAIDSAVAEFSASIKDKKKDITVLKVNEEHKFFGYAQNNSLVPYESTYVVLSNNRPKAFLLWYSGLDPTNEKVYKRMPGPLYVEVYWSNKANQAGRVLGKISIGLLYSLYINFFNYFYLFPQ
ncbi:hypothetical protein HYU06_01395, partial [Candidatus Woesearchaeota archaeon]|nr:hypothetical protein [Candidatus Woesearchaeota archaeon]